MTPFEIILVPFPFADLSSTKRRPCLVLGAFKPRALREHLLVAMMTSQVSPPHFPHDVQLLDYKGADLPKPTLVRLGKVVTLDSQLVMKVIGRLVESDAVRVRVEFAKLFHGMLGKDGRVISEAE